MKNKKSSPVAKKTGTNTERKNGKAWKKHPLKFDVAKGRLVRAN